MIPSLFLAIDEHGRVLLDEKRVEDIDALKVFFEDLRFLETGAIVSTYQGQTCLVEAFDAPWVLVDLQWDQQNIQGLNTYGFSIELNLQDCYFDEWDRLHGTLLGNMHWVLTRSAQEKFFESFDEYDDDSFVFTGKKYRTRSQYSREGAIEESKWWTDTYKELLTPNWDMKAPHPALVDMLPRMKLPRSRVLILGCGEGHDAAYLAREGHLVTAVDFSAEAIERAKKNYATLPIHFLQADAFHLPRQFDKAFDFIFEHTFFCAVVPEKRPEVLRVWNRCLIQGGYFMGVFFAVEKRSGPPFGSTEWEIRQRLQKDFHFLFWGRWKTAFGQRLGRELFVLSQKK